jgi:hypothetical protein
LAAVLVAAAVGGTAYYLSLPATQPSEAESVITRLEDREKLARSDIGPPSSGLLLRATALSKKLAKMTPEERETELANLQPEFNRFPALRGLLEEVEQNMRNAMQNKPNPLDDL